jgi:hypothetical protein
MCCPVAFSRGEQGDAVLDHHILDTVAEKCNIFDAKGKARPR